MESDVNFVGIVMVFIQGTLTLVVTKVKFTSLTHITLINLPHPPISYQPIFNSFFTKLGLQVTSLSSASFIYL